MIRASSKIPPHSNFRGSPARPRRLRGRLAPPLAFAAAAALLLPGPAAAHGHGHARGHIHGNGGGAPRRQHRHHPGCGAAIPSEGEMELSERRLRDFLEGRRRGLAAAAAAATAFTEEDEEREQRPALRGLKKKDGTNGETSIQTGGGGGEEEESEPEYNDPIVAAIEIIEDAAAIVDDPIDVTATETTAGAPVAMEVAPERGGNKPKDRIKDAGLALDGGTGDSYFPVYDVRTEDEEPSVLDSTTSGDGGAAALIVVDPTTTTTTTMTMTEAVTTTTTAATPTTTATTAAPITTTIAPASAITIPVYFHVIDDGNTAEAQVSDATIAAQMEKLNQDFAGLGSCSCSFCDSLHITPRAGPSIDTHFHFVLMETTRTTNQAWYEVELEGVGFVSQAERDMKASLRRGGCEALNIFTKFTGVDDYGWVMPPWHCTEPDAGRNLKKGDITLDPENDGVVLSFSVLPGGSKDHFNEGDTLVHEVGHWLGLYHTFDGGCNQGDAVEDTPPQSTPGYDCKLFGEQDSCPNKSGFDSITNFMDYTQDCCLYQFTPGQSERMWANYELYRKPRA